MNLEDPQLLTLITELYTTDHKINLQGKLKRNIENGKTLKEKLKSYKYLTSGKIVQLGTHTLCHDICEHLSKEEI